MPMDIGDRAIVEGVIRDIDSFKSAIEGTMSQLKGKVSGLNASWNDAQYTQFSDYIDELNSHINQNLAELDEAKNDLKRRLAYYD